MNARRTQCVLITLALLAIAGVAAAQGTTIPQSGWLLLSVDSEESEVCCYLAMNAFDGSASTMWATRWSSASPAPPHELQIDLGTIYAVSGFRYLPRQDGQSEGRIGQYEFYVSSDGVSWGAAVATGTFANSDTEKQITFTAKNGRYVRLRALTEVAGRPWTTVAELNVLATGNQAPNGTISAPAGDVTIAPGQTVTFSGSGSDPDNNLPLAYAWTFGQGGPPGSSSQNPGAVTFPNAGVYTVALTVTDALGAADLTPATRTVTVQAQAPLPIPQSGWTLRFVDSQETEVCCYLATNSFDGDAGTMWATRWASASPAPPHEIQIDLGASYPVAGFRYLPRTDGQPQGRIGQYEFYVSTDGVNWGTPAASGTFANSSTEKQVLFTARSGQYVRLRALTEVNGEPWTTMAELTVLAAGTLPNQAPNGSITAPAGDLTIAPGQSVFFSGSGTDPDNNVPLTYRWTFGAGGPPTSTSQNPGAVAFPNAGVYTVTFTVTDALGLADPTPATRTITVQTAGSAALIPQAGLSVRFVDSKEPLVSGYEAGKAIDGNLDTMWTTQWFNGGPPPPHEIQIDLGATYTVAGFRYEPYRFWQPGRIGDYEFYVSTDAVNWGAPVAAGAFADLNTAGPQDVFFAAKSGRYVRLRALSEVNNSGYSFTAVAELNVWRAGTGANQAPAATIASPPQNLTLVAGSALDLAGSGSDPDGHLPLTYRWRIGPGSGIADAAAQNPGYVHFDRPGTFAAMLTVTDSRGFSSTTTRTVTVVAGQPIAKAGWSVRFVDSQEDCCLAANAFDGNPSTLWTTQWVSSSPPPPHELQIDLGASRVISGIRYTPRQDGFTVGNIGQYELFISGDGVNWGIPVAVGMFANDASPKELSVPVTTGRYVRLRALTEVNDLPYTVIAELEVLERQCVTPSVRLIRPRSGHIQRSATVSIAADVCASQSGQGVRFDVDGVTVLTDYTAPYQLNSPSLTSSEHVVEATLVDGSGNRIPGVATYDIATPVGVGDFYVAIGDGITIGYGDDLATDDNTTDRRNLSGGYPAVLAERLTTARGYPVTVINRGRAGATSIYGASVVATLLQQYANANYFLVMYGHNDATAQIPSGRGLIPGSPGYEGSYKDFMQRIITAVRAAGKTALLTKSPPVLPLGGNEDLRIQDYNMVIDELAAIPGNGVTVVPPDQHTYFSTRTTTHYSNNVEMNGIGYEAMAQLWLSAILADQ